MLNKRASFCTAKLERVQEGLESRRRDAGQKKRVS